MQLMQIYSNSIWLMSSTEKDGLTAWRLVHRTCFFDIYNQYTWEAGYMHSYNAILSFDSLLIADSQDTIYAGLSQALAYTGLSSLSYMSPQHSSAVITKMSTCGSDHKISTTAVKPMEQMRAMLLSSHRGTSCSTLSTWRRSTITGRAFTKQTQSRRTSRRTKRERGPCRHPAYSCQFLAHRIFGIYILQTSGHVSTVCIDVRNIRSIDVQRAIASRAANDFYITSAHENNTVFGLL